ncbi:type II toxin-antitoxin system RelE/ParE family toxin [Lysobacter sp. KIS68-7]|uniref:type II toxin-antitoxin system RelE/ParE family toxin n=1 Tax=Lysobacter sp. KIS68-7 TaxID=2904252 RepID=UPI001E517DAB|nr:type II toxin-antitoxin system RelE/ParE family toxin [Lysobacter sp. KIS68-7]UHQ20682.1 type II toxin-antitoxin system RelE/ParE family toxin [Lysobacter sp. KIS68-7]
MLYTIRTTPTFAAWFARLRDRAAKRQIEARVDRLAHGNAGQHRVLTGGIAELKLDLGPGYRLYYTYRNGHVILLLCGGNKASQQQDIRRARGLAAGLEE